MSFLTRWKMRLAENPKIFLNPPEGVGYYFFFPFHIYYLVPYNLFFINRSNKLDQAHQPCLLRFCV
jgi:hypothetical protein